MVKINKSISNNLRGLRFLVVLRSFCQALAISFPFVLRTLPSPLEMHYFRIDFNRFEFMNYIFTLIPGHEMIRVLWIFTLFTELTEHT